MNQILINAIMEQLLIPHWGYLYIDQALALKIRNREEKLYCGKIKDEPLEFDWALEDRFLYYHPKLQRDLEEKTIVSIGLPYSLIKSMAHGMSRVESGAWEDDYHTVLKDKLRAIEEQIKPYTLFTPEVCVDTSRYIDREIGYYTGLGAYGKNHMLTHEAFGSQFHIGYLIYPGHLPFVTDEKNSVDFEKDRFKGCEGCSLCEKACPAMICGDFYNMNRALCISYLTQMKGEIKPEQMKSMGKNLYGCEVCQWVCPYNRVEESRPASFPGVDPIELLSMTTHAFKTAYGKKGFSWRPLWVYKRNALINIGNSGCTDALEAIKTLSFPERLKTAYEWAIAQLAKKM